MPRIFAVCTAAALIFSLGGLPAPVRADGDAAAGGSDLCGLVVGQVLGYETEPTAYHVAVHEDLFHHAAHQVDRNRKTDTFRPSIRAIEHGRIDADQITVRVDEGAA